MSSARSFLRPVVRHIAGYGNHPNLPVSLQHRAQPFLWNSIAQFNTNAATPSATPQSAATQSPATEGTSSATLEFKAETLKLLKIVTHSLYTDKEVFLRELISNASDALEKLRFSQATGRVSDILDPEIGLHVNISVDADKKTVTVTDTGIGMTRTELIENLGTIAKSGSLGFVEDTLSAQDAANHIIGQFGVGFYSSFIVADRIDVFTRSYNPEESGWHWESDGLGTFTIRECPNLSRGTKVVCHLKSTCSDFSIVSKLKAIAEKFSSYIAFPLMFKEADGTEVDVSKRDALWLKSNPTEEEHKAFYRSLTEQSWSSPMYWISYQSDVPLSLKCLLYVPEEPPSRLFNKVEAGVSLHSKRILVSKAPENLIPRWLNFLKGVVDCEDMPLNIAREGMQDTILMTKLSTAIVKKFLSFLHSQMKSDYSKYKLFYARYSQYLKEGFLEDMQGGGSHSEAITNLLRFESSQTEEGSTVSLAEYLNRCHPNQNHIYYFSASSRATAASSPYLEPFKPRGIEVLYMLEDIDEFVAMHLMDYKGKKLMAIDTVDEATLEKELAPIEPKPSEIPTPQPALEANARDDLAKFVQTALGQRVSQVKFTERLTQTPAIVSGFLPSSLRRMMKATMKESPNNKGGFSELPATLELNPSHSLITSLHHLKDRNPIVAEVVIKQIWDNARITAGILEEPREMLPQLTQLVELVSSYAYHHDDSQGGGGSGPTSGVSGPTSGVSGASSDEESEFVDEPQIAEDMDLAFPDDIDRSLPKDTEAMDEDDIALDEIARFDAELPPTDLSIPQMDVPELDVPLMDVPEMDPSVAAWDELEDPEEVMARTKVEV